jgi:hypothetical protein
MIDLEACVRDLLNRDLDCTKARCNCSERVKI